MFFLFFVGRAWVRLISYEYLILFSSWYWWNVNFQAYACIIVGIMTPVWHYDIGVVLDGNSLRWQIIVQAHRMKEKEIYAGSPWPSRVYTQVSRPKGVYAYTSTFTQGKARTCWKTKFWFVVFGPWYFRIGPWYLVRSVDPRYWVQGIVSTWFWTMVLREA